MFTSYRTKSRILLYSRLHLSHVYPCIPYTLLRKYKYIRIYLSCFVFYCAPLSNENIEIYYLSPFSRTNVS